LPELLPAIEHDDDGESESEHEFGIVRAEARYSEPFPPRRLVRTGRTAMPNLLTSGLMASDAKRCLAELGVALSRHGTPERAAQERRYLKSHLEFIGASVPSIRREAKVYARAHPVLDRKNLRALAEAAWASGVHELRSVAIAILEQKFAVLRPADATWLIGLVERSDTWAHVDWLAVKVIGALGARYPVLARQVDRWVKHENFWVRRTALLSFHDPLRAGGGDFEHFARLAATLVDEREFFIRKAIGWVLRSVALRRPELVVEFVEEHAGALSGVTFREATRRLSPAARRRLERLRASATAPRSAPRRARAQSSSASPRGHGTRAVLRRG
jgi:3-methyladenine DNA glycosylase AlkD